MMENAKIVVIERSAPEDMASAVVGVYSSWVQQ